MYNDANDLYAEQDKLGAINYAELEYRYQESAAADTGFAEPEYNLGLLYQREGKLDQAAQAYQEALRRRPRSDAGRRRSGAAEGGPGPGRRGGLDSRGHRQGLSRATPPFVPGWLSFACDRATRIAHASGREDR